MRRRLALALLAALLPLAVAACGSSSGGGESDGQPASVAVDAANPLAAAAAKTLAAGSSKVSFSAAVALPGQGGSGELTGEGAFDYASRRGELTFDLSALLGNLGALGEGSDGKAVIVFDKLVLYMNFPLLANLLPGGKEWIKIDLATVGEQQGVDLGAFVQAGQNDPSQFLTYLNGADQIEEVGEETVRDVATTHYKAVIDFEKTLQQAPEELRAQLQQTLDDLRAQGGATTRPIEVWVDADGFVRRVLLDSAADAQAAGNVVTMEFFDYGTDVTVDIPSSDQVTDLAELGGLGFGVGQDTTTTP